jgi:UDP-N-acetylmuramate dehydrogenase
MTEVTPVPLSRLTTLRTGGAPARMFEASTADELVDTLREVWGDRDEWFVLGGGSNMFVGDDPFDGTVVRIRTQGIERLPAARRGFVRLRVQAGHDWDALVAYAVAEGLAGIEAMSGIPGTVGAAPVQNIGAYGQEIVQTLVEVDLIDESTGEVSTVPAGDLGLGFRTSVLKHHHGSVPERRAVILSVTLELAEVGHGERPIAGEQLRTALGLAAGEGATVAWVRDHVLATRARKGMVLDPDDSDTYSAGSFFQNAVVSASFARTLPDACPRWPVTPDLDPVLVIPLAEFDGYVAPPAAVPSDVKVSAAWLIEHSGLRKGFKLPRSRAALSSKHALALTNRGAATAAELAELARYIQGRVQSEFGLILQPEPVLVGVEL